MINGPQCEGCDVILGSPQAGGAAGQLFPLVGEAAGGVTHGRAAFPYLAWTDAQRYPPYIQVAWLDTTVANHAPSPHLAAPGAVGDRWNPRLQGHRLVWMDTRNDPEHGLLDPRNVDIYARDLATGEGFAACTDPALQEDPDVEGDLVVWTDYRHNADPTARADATQSDIYLADLGASREVRLTQLPGFARDPRIDRGRVFFTWQPDERAAQIYVIDLAARGLVGP